MHECDIGDRTIFKNQHFYLSLKAIDAILTHKLFNGAGVQWLDETRKWRISDFRSRIPRMFLEFFDGKIEWQPPLTCCASRQPGRLAPTQNCLVHRLHTGAVLQADSLYIAHCIVRQHSDRI